jgi:hypothetical protein
MAFFHTLREDAVVSLHPVSRSPRWGVEETRFCHWEAKGTRPFLSTYCATMRFLLSLMARSQQ